MNTKKVNFGTLSENRGADLALDWGCNLSIRKSHARSKTKASSNASKKGKEENSTWNGRSLAL